MRVNFIGNTCNNNYLIAKGLRGIGVDANLYYSSYAGIPQDLPSSEDPELNHLGPEWIHGYERQRNWMQPDHVLGPHLLTDLSDCDILHVHGMRGVVWANRTHRPFVWQPYGFDLFHESFYSWCWMVRRKKGIPFLDLRNLLQPFIMRRAIKSTSAIVIGWHNELWVPGFRLLRKLGVVNRITRGHLAIDTDSWTPLSVQERAALRAKWLPELRRDSLVIFHPTRHAFTRNISNNTRKGNDRLYHALADLHKRGKEFRLLVVERNIPDEKAAKKLISSLGLTNRVQWVKVMPRHELKKWYQIADLTADHFVAGALGAVPLESLSCGTPVLTYVKMQGHGPDFMDPGDLYPEMPPVVNVSTESQIRDALSSILADRSKLEEFGKSGRRWVTTYCSMKSVAQRFHDLYRRILNTVPQERNQV